QTPPCVWVRSAFACDTNQSLWAGQAALSAHTLTRESPPGLSEGHWENLIPFAENPEATGCITDGHHDFFWFPSSPVSPS
ncbi:hypothetical protein BaRGS_00017223, partial [Batillaria attramentaria]